MSLLSRFFRLNTLAYILFGVACLLAVIVVASTGFSDIPLTIGKVSPQLRVQFNIKLICPYRTSHSHLRCRCCSFAATRQFTRGRGFVFGQC